MALRRQGCNQNTRQNNLQFLHGTTTHTVLKSTCIVLHRSKVSHYSSCFLIVNLHIGTCKGWPAYAHREQWPTSSDTWISKLLNKPRISGSGSNPLPVYCLWEETISVMKVSSIASHQSYPNCRNATKCFAWSCKKSLPFFHNSTTCDCACVFCNFSPHCQSCSLSSASIPSLSYRKHYPYSPFWHLSLSKTSPANIC